MRVAAYIIHLERATERAAQVAALRAALPVPSEVLQAVDARAGRAVLGDHYDPALGLQPRYPFPLSATEVAVFLSHRKAWARIVADGVDAGLVVEDDIHLDPKLFPPAYALARDRLEDRQWVRFPQRAREVPASVVAERDGVLLVRPKVVALGNLVQLIHRGTAEHLLSLTERFDRPVDTLLQMRWETGIDMLTLLPPPVREISAALGGSTQRKRRGFRARLHAEVARALYRHRIARLSHRFLS